MSLTPFFLNHAYVFKPLYQFYIDTNDNQIEHINYTVRLEDKYLPFFSDQEYEIRDFK